MKTRYGDLEFVEDYAGFILNVNGYFAGVVSLPAKDVGWTFLGNGEIPMTATQYSNIAHFLQQLNEEKK